MKITNAVRNLSTFSKMLQAKIFYRRFPLSVTFIITYRCNFQCHYCDVYSGDEKEMTTPEIFSMINQLVAMGMRRLGINGGEPLLREDIGDIITYAKKKKLYVTLFTNGSFVPEKIQEIKGVDLLLMSLDGPCYIHDAQRSWGSFDMVIEALKVAKDAGLNIWTNTVITKHNVDSLDFILGLANTFKIKTIYQPVWYYSHSTQVNKINELSPDKEQYHLFIDRLIQEKKRGGPVAHSFAYLHYIRNPDWRYNKRHCWASKLYCAITPSGKVAPCYPIFKDKEWPNGLVLGFRQALKSILEFSCNGCYCILVENDFFFSLHPEVVCNTLKELK